jgi:predicted component of type VI protein secretion system
MAFLDRFNPAKVRTDELDHIVSNISSVLNTKQGFGSIVRQLGVGEYQGRPGSRDAIATLRAEIETEIGKFEPRLTELEVKLLGKSTDLQMVFDVSGKVAGKRCQLRVFFHTNFGNFVVERASR